MTSGFDVHDAAGYERLMGRWSQKPAPLFIDFAGLLTAKRFSMSATGSSVDLTIASASELLLSGAGIFRNPAADRTLTEELSKLGKPP